MAVSPANDASQRLIEAHLSKHFSLGAGQVSLSAVTPENLPEGARQYYVEPKGGHGHRALNYIVIGSQLYCSGVEGDFARLLSENHYLERKGLTAAQVMSPYRTLASPPQVMIMAAGYPQFAQIKPPALTLGEQGMSLVFFASAGIPLEPRRWTVTVSRDYRVEVHTGELLKPTP